MKFANRLIKFNYIGMIYLITLLSIFSCNSSANPGNSVENEGQGVYISGTVGYPQSGNIIVEAIENNQAVPYDTITLNEDYTYKHFVKFDQPSYFRLNFYGKQFVVVILNKEDITVNVDGNKRDGFVEVTGSSDHNLIIEVQQAMMEFNNSPEMMNVNQNFNDARNRGDNEGMAKIQSDFMQMRKAHQDELAAIIRKNPTSLAAIELLSNNNVIETDNYFDLLEYVVDETSKAMPGSPYVMAFADKVKSLKVFAIGQVAPDIELPNPDGDIVKLSSLRGNYVLVDFWAKWCKPCRMENPNVVKMYKKYNDKGFEVYGVSLDRNKADWLQAINEDGLHWTQVSDLKYWNSAAAKLYNVTSIPFALLLDPEGRIIGKNLRGVALEEKLASIFGE
ncbi:MAG: AhpC/TSA family protein [Cyclobacteriaceae bacterium]|nr:AhpC/TSA family protein [Cyclobacteriaceae bacterium]